LSVFRRKESLHEKLAREGGLVETETTAAPWDKAGIHGVARPRRWDAVVTAEAELDGDSARFVALPDGSLLVEEGPDDVAPLAEAVERELKAPYRAEAVRRGTRTWAVAARRIQVVALPGVEGEEIGLALRDGQRSLVVDGSRAFGSVPALEELGSDPFAVQATRLDGDLFEIELSRL